MAYLSWALFYLHLFTFIGVNVLLIITNFLISPEAPWFIIPLTFWGLVLLAHYLGFFFFASRSAQRWRDSQSEKIGTVPLFWWMMFYLHLYLFLGSSFIMAIINYIVTPKEYWSIITIISWGMSVAIHYSITLIAFSKNLETWREKKIASFQKNKVSEREAMMLFGFWVAFRIHACLYTITNVLLIGIDVLLNHSGQRWFWYPLFGWGAALGGHWVMTFFLLRANRSR
jgi:hypothetical protein